MLVLASALFAPVLTGRTCTVSCARITHTVAGKPLVIGEFGSQRPMDIRNLFFAAIYDELAAAKQAGQPIVGV